MGIAYQAPAGMPMVAGCASSLILAIWVGASVECTHRHDRGQQVPLGVIRRHRHRLTWAARYAWRGRRPSAIAASMVSVLVSWRVRPACGGSRRRRRAWGTGRGALADEPRAGRRVTASQDRGQIGLRHLPGEEQSPGAPTPPRAVLAISRAIAARPASSPPAPGPPGR
jgi:hypothetical protein